MTLLQYGKISQTIYPIQINISKLYQLINITEKQIVIITLFVDRYILPPTSRPRYNNPDTNIFRTTQHDQQSQQQQQHQYQQQSQQYQKPQYSQPQYQQPQQHQGQYQSVAAASSSSTTSTTTTTTTTAAPPTYGTIISNPNQLPSDITKSVNSLALQYIPNVGNKYVAIVPQSDQKAEYISSNDVYDKYNGKYNPKLKKYKAYEQKAKLMPYLTVS